VIPDLIRDTKIWRRMASKMPKMNGKTELNSLENQQGGKCNA
jgi:hypothetical protein